MHFPPDPQVPTRAWQELADAVRHLLDYGALAADCDAVLLQAVEHWLLERKVEHDQRSMNGKEE